MAQKWSQKYISNPFTSLMPTDIIAIARSGTSGAAQWGTLFSNLCSGQGSTFRFDTSGGTIKLKVTDDATNNNTILGLSSGNGSMSGQYNTGYGSGVLNDLTNGNGNSALGYLSSNGITSGQNNTSYGYLSLWQLKTGTFNIAIGSTAASNYTSNESFNINIGSSGTVGDSHVTRIGYINGTASTQSGCYIDGITGIPVSGNQVFVDSNGRLGVGGSLYEFNAWLTTDVDNVTGDGTTYSFIYDHVQSNIGSMYDSTTGIVTIPVDGTYIFNSIMTTQNQGDSHTNWLAGFSYNTSVAIFQIYTGNFWPVSNTSLSPTLYTANGSVILSLTAGSIIQVTVKISNSSKSIGVTGRPGNAIFNSFSGSLLRADS